MKALRTWAILAQTLALLGLGALFLSFLALSDIFHGEEDASLEWGILLLTLFVLLFLIIATFILTGLTFKGLRAQAPAKIWASISGAMGIAGLVLLVVSAVALAGIRHGNEGGPPAWALVRLAYLAIVVVIMAVLVSTGLLFRHFRDGSSGQD